MTIQIATPIGRLARGLCALTLVGAVPAAGITADDKGDARTGALSPGPPPAKVRVGAVTRKKIRSRMNLVGRIREVRSAIVAAEREGRVVKVEVEEGDRVNAGRTLGRLDDAVEKLDMALAEAQLAQARAEVVEAKALLDRGRRHHTYLQELETKGMTTPKEVEDARDVATGAEARLDRTEAGVQESLVRLARSLEDLRRSTIEAPFDGVVVKKLTEAGQWVDQGGGVVEMISRGLIDALIDVPERLINHIRPGEPIEIVIEALSISVAGTVHSVIPMGSAAARTFPVRIRFEDQDGRFKVGMSVLAQVPTGAAEQLLTVPRDAIQRSPNGTVVWADVGGKALPVPIRVLFGHGDRYAVETIRGAGPELAAPMNVVVEGAERLFPHQPLIIVPPPTTARRGTEQ